MNIVEIESKKYDGGLEKVERYVIKYRKYILVGCIVAFTLNLVASLVMEHLMGIQIQNSFWTINPYVNIVSLLSFFGGISIGLIYMGKVYYERPDYWKLSRKKKLGAYLSYLAVITCAMSGLVMLFGWIFGITVWVPVVGAPMFIFDAATFFTNANNMNASQLPGSTSANPLGNLNPFAGYWNAQDGFGNVSQTQTSNYSYSGNCDQYLADLKENGIPAYRDGDWIYINGQPSWNCATNSPNPDQVMNLGNANPLLFGADSGIAFPFSNSGLYSLCSPFSFMDGLLGAGGLFGSLGGLFGGSGFLTQQIMEYALYAVIIIIVIGVIIAVIVISMKISENRSRQKREEQMDKMMQMQALSAMSK